MRQLEHLYHQLYPWLASLYDAESGGFYYARSAIGVEHFAPDIESTAFAVDLIEAGGLLQQMPAPVREGLIAYFQSRQDDRTGYFIDPQNEMGTMERMRGRAVKMATIALQKLGATPLHSLPGSTSGGSDLDELGLAFLKSPGALVDWIEAQPWDHSWTALDAVASQAEILASFAPERRAPLLEAAYLYLDGHVRVYHGSNANLPRRYVSRQKLCLRGTTDYWINDALGRPFFVVSKAVTKGLATTLLLADLTAAEFRHPETGHRFIYQLV